MSRPLYLFIMTLIPMVVNAFDIQVNGIYYLLDSSTHQAEVTYGDDKYIGAVIIPASIRYGGINYSVSSVGEKAFYDCTELTAVTLPETITSIGGLAFCWCSGLKSLYIPPHVRSVGWFCFAYCTNLTYITLPSTVNDIGYGAFSHCSQLTSFSLPTGIKRIERFLFEGCSALTAIDIPEGILEIGTWAFNGCSKIQTIKLPSTLESVEQEAFRGCHNLSLIVSNALFPPQCDDTAFDATDVSLATLYVPNESLDMYLSTTPWNSFGTILALQETAVRQARAQLPKTAIFSLGGHQLATPQKGVNIIRGKKFLVK